MKKQKLTPGAGMFGTPGLHIAAPLSPGAVWWLDIVPVITSIVLTTA
jgi:hypothetical protein